MVAPLYIQVRTALENTPGKTQKGLAARMDISASAVNRMLHGKRNIMASEIPIIADYLGVQFDLSGVASSPANDIEYRQEPRRRGGDGFSDVRRQPAPRESALVPVYGPAAGSLQGGLNLAKGHIADWAPRHPAQSGIQNAFAIYAFSDAMEPRYFPGELVYVHPGRPPAHGRDCVIEMQNGDASIKRYLHQTDTTVRVAQLNPPLEKDIPKAEIKAIYAVVGRG